MGKTLTREDKEAIEIIRGLGFHSDEYLLRFRAEQSYVHNWMVNAYDLEDDCVLLLGAYRETILDTDEARQWIASYIEDNS